MSEATDRIMDQIADLTRQLGEFAAANAAPAAELAGRVIQMKAAGLIVMPVVAWGLTGILLTVAYNRGVKTSEAWRAHEAARKVADDYNLTREERTALIRKIPPAPVVLTISAVAPTVLGFFALLASIISTIDGGLFKPLYWVAAFDWRFALAAKILGVIQ